VPFLLQFFFFRMGARSASPSLLLPFPCGRRDRHVVLRALFLLVHDMLARPAPTPNALLNLSGSTYPRSYPPFFPAANGGHVAPPPVPFLATRALCQADQLHFFFFFYQYGVEHRLPIGLLSSSRSSKRIEFRGVFFFPSMGSAATTSLPLPIIIESVGVHASRFFFPPGGRDRQFSNFFFTKA